MVGREVEVERHHPPHPEGRRAGRSTLAAIIAIGAAGYGVWTAVWGLGGAIGWWLIPVSALSLIVAFIRIHARLGLEDRTRVKRLEAFRTYLKDFSDLPNAPALAVIIWEHYLEWAVALDVADAVETGARARPGRELAVADPRCPDRSGRGHRVAPFPGGGTHDRRRLDREREQRVLEWRVRLVQLVQRLLRWGLLRRRWRGRRRNRRGRG